MKLEGGRRKDDAREESRRKDDAGGESRRRVKPEGRGDAGRMTLDE